MLERGVSMFYYEEGFSDVQYHEYVYVGRRCRTLKVEASASRGTVELTNTGDTPLTNLDLKFKFFSHGSRVVREKHLDVLAPGQVVLVKDTDDDFGLDCSVIMDLGMLYVRVRCDQGYAMSRGRHSYW